MEPLQSFRAEIDALDDDIVRLLAARFEVVRQVAAYKAEAGIPVRLPDRIEAVCKRNAEQAADLGLDPQLVDRLYRMIIDAACALEVDLIEPDEQKAL